MVQSLQASQGNFVDQITYLEWIRTHNRFDYEAMLSDFLHRCGWNILVPEEQTGFLQAFHRVPGHFNTPEAVIKHIGYLIKHRLFSPVFQPEGPTYY